MCESSPTGAHHWKIGNQEGPTVPGICKYCSEEKQFNNSLIYDGPDDNRNIGKYRFRDPIAARTSNIY